MGTVVVILQAVPTLNVVAVPGKRTTFGKHSFCMRIPVGVADLLSQEFQLSPVVELSELRAAPHLGESNVLQAYFVVKIKR
jgi:hypothetical protein